VLEARVASLEEAPVALEVRAQVPASRAEVGHLDDLRAQEVGAEDHAIAEVDDDVADRADVATSHVGDRRRGVDVVVRIRREHPPDLGPAHEAAEVQADEAGGRVRRDDDLELLVQPLQRRELAAAVPPVRVLTQLLDPRVAVGQRREERGRIAGVDGDWQAELRGGRPERLEPRVADRDAAAGGVAQPQPEVLPHLHADGASAGGFAQLALERLQVGEVRHVAAQQRRLEALPLRVVEPGRRPAAIPQVDRRREPADPVDVVDPRSRRGVVMAVRVEDLAAITRVLGDHFDSAAAFSR
jgi:hypothetical protein